MKKLLLLLSAVGMIFTACEAGGGLDEGGGSLPTGSIATIEQQSANIAATIATLETTKAAVNSTIASLGEQQPATRGNDNGNNGVKSMIAALEERVEALEAMISNLQNYTEGELSQSEDWVSTTFATLEQQEALANELAEIKSLLTAINGVSTAKLNEAITASETSLKSWVNESLTGYCTVADMNAQVAALKLSSAEDNQVLQKEIDSINLALKNLKSDIEESYKEAISEAITNYAGVINTTIAKEIAEVNNRINKEIANINSRLDNIEKRLDNVEGLLNELMKSVNSISYIGEDIYEVYMEFTPEESVVKLNYQVTPKTAVADLEKVWNYAIATTAYVVKNGEVEVVDLPITSFKGNTKTGIITMTVSGENFLGEQLSDGNLSWSLLTSITNNVKEISSSPIYLGFRFWQSEIITATPQDNEIYLTYKYPVVLSKQFKIGDNEIEKVSYNQKLGCHVVTYKEPITYIPKRWQQTFEDGEEEFYSYEIYSYSLPNSVTTIEDEAFSELWSCKSITLGNGIKTVGNRAFSANGVLEKVNVQDIAAYCKIDFKSANAAPATDLYLNGEKIVDLHIPEVVTEVKSYAFYGVESIQNIYFSHETPPTLGELALGQPNGASNPVIHIPEGSMDAYMSSDWNLIYKSWIDGAKEADYLKSPDAYTIVYVTTDGEQPDISLDYGVSHSFSGGVGMITFPAAIVNIKADLFRSSRQNLKCIALPSSVQAIEDRAFMHCGKLKGVNLEYGLISIGSSAFKSTALEEIHIPATVTKIGSEAFYDTKLKDITIPDSITNISNGAFYGCSSLSAFYGKFASSDNRCLIVDGVLHSFAPAGLSEYVIPDSVTSIGISAFDGCNSLTNITIPNSVTEIAGKAFYGCSSLTSVTIPESVTSIENRAFLRCSNLTAFYGKFASSDNRCLIVGGVLNSFSPAGLTEYTIPDSVTSIGSYAFYECRSLTSVTIPDSVTSIGGSAFYNCRSLTSVTIPDSVTSIGGSAFYNCRSLTSVTIGNSVTSIGEEAFSYCTSLTSVTVPDSVASIGSFAFLYCSSLTSVYCKPTTPPTGGGEMFYSNASGRTIYVPRSSVSAYKSASYWSDYADYIEGYDF